LINFFIARNFFYLESIFPGGTSNLIQPAKLGYQGGLVLRATEDVGFSAFLGSA
jgi:hypothetical protein